MAEFLSSKLTPPVTAIKPVPRVRLDMPTAFQHGQQRLIALSAPAGYGKSTLMLQWWQQLEAAKKRCLWLGLDALDAAPNRFEQALIGALQLSEGDDLKTALIHFDAQQTDITVLFIDDVHFLHAQDSENVLRWLLAHLPANLQLVIAGRSMPESSGLSRRVLEGSASRLDARDLALTTEELAALLQTPADQPWLQDLQQQTEGWPLAARIVALSSDETGRIQAPTGRDRDLSAYLTDVLLEGLPEEIRPLVFAASLLPRFCSEQLDAMLAHSASQQQLQWLESNNLFLIPLDRERRWYRFHHLIAEFLADRLQTENATQAQQWQQTAAQWCENQSLMEDAISLAMTAGDYAVAADRLERVAVQLAQYQGKHEQIVAWIAALPPEHVAKRYLLRLNHIVAITFTGELERARKLATDLLKDVAGNVDEKQEKEFQSAAEVFACIIAALEDEPQLAEELSGDWLEQWHQSSPLFAGAACSARGYAAKCRSAFDEALAWTQRGKQLFVKAGSIYAEAWATALQAVTLLRMGSLSAARDLLQNTLHAAERRLGRNSPGTSTLAGLTASVELEMGHIDNAAELLCFDFETLGSQTSTDGLIAVWLTAARIKAMKGQTKAAQAILLDGEGVGQERGLPRLVLSLAAERAVNHIRAGRLELARNIVSTEFAPFESRDDLQGLIADKRQQLEVRLSLAAGLADEVIDTIHEQCQRATAKEQLLKALQWQVFASAACSDTQRITAAEEAIRLVEKTGAMRILAADADLIRPVLQTAIDKAGINSALAERVRQTVGVEALAPASKLTKKELQILEAVAEGLSNKELASRLFVSEGTVKWHLHNIYNKLDTKNRSGALAKARAAGLIA